MDLLDQRRPSLALALRLLEGVRAEADARELALAMCVVDGGGHVIAAQRMDGAALGAMPLAEGKAYTAALWGTRTGDFTESTQPGGADWGWNTTDPRVVYAGGIPLVADGQLIGGLGASGGAADEDEACAVAAARACGF